MATVALVLSLLPRTAHRYLTARWSRQLLGTLGVRLRGSGAAPEAGLLVANHVSWLDIYAINALAPTTFVAKDELRHWPVIGWFSARTGTIFLERGSRNAAMAAKEHVVEKLRQGACVGIFPEGTTSHGDHVQPFHGALFQAAIDADAPVMPVALRYTNLVGAPTHGAAYAGGTTFWQCLRAIAKADGFIVHLAFLPPQPPAGLDRRHLAHRSHQLIASRLARPGDDRATETPAGRPAAPRSGCHPTDSLNPAPADFPSA